MVRTIAYHLIWGKPVLMYLGLLTLFFLLFTATVGWLNYHNNRTIGFRWHPRLATTTIILALIHAILGLSIYYNF